MPQSRRCNYEGLKIRQSSFSAGYQTPDNARATENFQLPPPTTLTVAHISPPLPGIPSSNALLQTANTEGITYRRSSIQSIISPLGSGLDSYSPQPLPGSIASNVAVTSPPILDREHVTEHRPSDLISAFGRSPPEASPKSFTCHRRDSRRRVSVTKETEGNIFNFFIKHAGPWLDIVSPARHFGQTVPRLALSEPVLYCACLAYSAHVMFLTGQIEKSVEEAYQSKAIGLLIPLLSAHSQPWKDEIMLATTVILRMSEQFSEVGDDAQHHLNGAFSLFGTSGHRWSPFQTDVRGVSFWIYVRENIRICFLSERGCKFDKKLFEDEAFTEGPDEVWTNRMTYLLARSCSACWGDSGPDQGEMMHLTLLLKQWFSNVPDSFTPWGSFELDHKPFPAMRFLSTWHGTFLRSVLKDILTKHALDFSHCMAAVLCRQGAPGRLCASRERLKCSDFKPVHAGELNSMRIDDAHVQELRPLMPYQTEILEPARRLCGVCLSSGDVGSDINGSHLIAWCGQFFTGREEQRCLIEYLNTFMDRTKWPNKTCSERLERIWSGVQRGWIDRR